MTKLNAKQWLLIAACFAVAAVINFLIWLFVMGDSGGISGLYHFGLTLCLAATFLIVADRFAKTGIYK
jgi:F0F1-type ATP synthase assembly protein I